MSPTIVGIGELLWDVFGEERRLGGAPVNFACHCSQLGTCGVPVSCVGEDFAGDEILRAVADLGVETAYLQREAVAPTGTVQVTLDEKRVPAYTITENVAWDSIRLTPALLVLATVSDAVCFGSLAQRSPTTRNTVRRFIALCPDTALKLFDVNLRRPFYEKTLLEESLRLANAVKLSDEELPLLAEMFGLTGSAGAQLRQLLQLFGLRLAACTRGKAGSLLVTPEEEVEQPAGVQDRVVSTVGAGDAFAATLCVGLLRGLPLEAIGRHANEVAAYVCGHEGATPVFPDTLRNGQPAA